MTDELAREFVSRHWQDRIFKLFISEVRIGPSTKRESEQAQKDRIHRDMISQQDWHVILQPIFSILKFRLPWNGSNASYLNGIIYLPVYGKVLTREARICVQKGTRVGDYDNKLYEGQMAYINQEFRPAIYDYAGQSRCFDCTSFRWIVCNYLKASGTTLTAQDGPAIDARCLVIVTTLTELKRQWLSTSTRSIERKKHTH